MDRTDITKITDALTFALAAPSPNPDEAAPNTGLQVWSLEFDCWMPATRGVWEAWTDLRAVWGIPYHGPVYPLGAPPGSAPWSGARTCGCSTCQEHVTADCRPS